MLTEFLLRLAVVLPLICALAALSLWSVRRGWIRLPGLPAFPAIRSGVASARGMASPPALEILAVRSLSPAARLAVVRFDGRDLLLGVAGQSVALIAQADLSRPEPSLLPEQAQ
jgi:hypothetical protein